MKPPVQMSAVLPSLDISCQGMASPLTAVMLETIPLPVFYKGTDGVYLGCNSAFEQLVGKPRHEIIGFTAVALATPEKAELFAKMDAKVYDHPEHQIYETVLEFPGKGRFEVIFHKAPFYDEKGNLAGLVGVIVDITQQRAAEAELLKAKEIAENATRAKSQFLAMISHDIRIPLQGLLGFSSLLGETQLTPEQRVFLEKIQFSGNMLHNLVGEILDFSRIEACRLKLDWIPFSLFRCLQKVMDLFTLGLNKRDVEFRLVLGDELPAVIIGDESRLQQILTNLLGNAMKFTQAGHIILSVRVASADTHELPPLLPGGAASGKPVRLHFEVQDTGIGISPGELERLFQPFEQADSTISSRFGGAGLGLSIVRQLTELMGGTVQAQSEPGKGSTFGFSLVTVVSAVSAEELQASSIVSAKNPSRRAAQGSNPVLSILIVDDHHPNADLASQMFEYLGHRADIVLGGKECLERIRHSSYDLLCVDLMMPEMDGTEVTRKIRQNADPKVASLYIVGNTAGMMSEDKDRCIQAGMNDFLRKPMSLNDLEKMIQRFLSRR